MKVTKVITALTAFLLIASCVGCKEDKETVSVAETTVTTFEPLYNLDGLRYVLYVNSNGEEEMRDSDGNLMKKNENGEWVDEDGNVITEYKDNRDKSSNEVEDSSANEENNRVNNEPIKYNEVQDIINNGGVEDNGGNDVVDAGYFSYQSSIDDYNPQAGDKSLESGTEIIIPIMLSNGIEIKGKLSISSVVDTEDQCGIKGTLSYDVDGYIEHYKNTYGDKLYSIDDEGNVIESDNTEIIKSIEDTTVNCSVQTYAGGGIYNATATQEIKLNADGVTEIDCIGSCDGGNQSTMLVFDGYYLAVGD